MKRTSWNTALCCGLAISLSSIGLTASAFADDGKDGKGGKQRDKSPADRSDAPRGNNAQSGKDRGRNGNNPQSGRPRDQRRDTSQTGKCIDQGRGNSQRNNSRIGNQPFAGNTVTLGTRSINVGSGSYQPSYYRHSGYHGYWSGNRGFRGPSAIGSGSRSGSRLGIGINIGGTGIGIDLGSGRATGIGGRSGNSSGWGWGLGNRYGGGHDGYHPVGWGMGGWGLGSLYYSSGYLGYSNPYYNNRYGSHGSYSYTQPIPVSYNTAMAIAQDNANTAGDVLSNAVAAFQQNEYDAALDIINKGVTQYPDDAVLHEFRSLVLFARQDYQQSASTIHSVLAVGPGWDWATLSSMYVSVPIYTAQLRALEAFTTANPQDAASRFLLAYHYMSCGRSDSAATRLQQVVKLSPNDRVAADLAKMLAPPQAGQPDESSKKTLPNPTQAPVGPVVKPINATSLAGTWKAARADGSTFNLILTTDAKFTWSFASKGQAAQEFGGAYSVEGNVLALERKDGGSLIAAITPAGEAKFNFKLLGAPDDDPGLDFSK